MLLVIVGVVGGSFIITKLLLAFYTGRTRIQGIKTLDDSNILTQLDNLQAKQNNKSNVTRHVEFLKFALDKKQIVNCPKCRKKIIYTEANYFDIEKGCITCQKKQ